MAYLLLEEGMSVEQITRLAKVNIKDVQNWIDEKGKETIVARSVRNAMNWRAGTDWDIHKPMEIKIRRTS